MKAIFCAALLPHAPFLLPEIGGEKLDKLPGTVEAMRQTAQRFKEHAVQTVIIMTPHGIEMGDAVTISVYPRLRGSMEQFGEPELTLGFETDGLLLKAIIKQAKRLGIHLAEMTDDRAKDLRRRLELDYGAFVPLYYLHQAGFRGQIVHMSCSLASYEELYTCGKAVQKAVMTSGRRTGIIVSGNLSHRLSPEAKLGYHPGGALFDERIREILTAADWKSLMMFDRDLAEAAGQCALRSIFFLAGTLGGVKVKKRILVYEAPEDTGYAVACFEPLLSGE